MDYRKFYEEQTELPLSSDIHIHHIDGDRDNNKIINLVALPAKLHQSYHMYCNMLPDKININKAIPNTVGICEKPVMKINYDTIKGLRQSRSLIINFISFRDHLLGFCWQPYFNKINSYNELINEIGLDYE